MAALRLPLRDALPESVISRFGDPRAGGRRRHQGIDIAAPRGTRVLAPAAGRVRVSGVRSLGGNVVVVETTAPRYEVVFSHLDRRLVRVGEAVAAGQPIGLVGTTGNAAGGPPHLHFEVHGLEGPLDPYPLLYGGAAARSRRR